MNEEKHESTDLLCEDCGETFSQFLQEMADQNAKVATCPKCGKIHEHKPVKSGRPRVGSAPPKKIH